MDVQETLAQRQVTHGDFGTTAMVSQQLTSYMHATPNWAQLTFVQKEGLEMIQHKVARLLCGNPNEPDHIHDIIGYATLIEKSYVNS